MTGAPPTPDDQWFNVVGAYLGPVYLENAFVKISRQVLLGPA
jgi:hypothetical protein